MAARGLASSGNPIVRSLALVRPCLGHFPPYSAHVPFLDFSYYSLLYMILVYASPCCSHARGILCGIHTSIVESPFSIVHAKWSLVFWSFATSSQRLSTALSLVYNNNDILIICRYGIYYNKVKQEKRVQHSIETMLCQRLQLSSAVRSAVTFGVWSHIWCLQSHQVPAVTLGACSHIRCL